MSNPVIDLGSVPKDGSRPNSWCTLDASTFAVRGAKYDTDRVKVPSAPSFYECATMDLFLAPNKPAGFITPSLKLPPTPFDNIDLPIPHQVVIVFPLPRYCPTLLGTPNDGDSLVFVAVLTITEQTVKQVLAPLEEHSNALKLWKRFVDDPEPLVPQFKYIRRLEEKNMQALINEFLGWTTSWMKMLVGLNGKPSLSKNDTYVSLFNDRRTIEIQHDYHVGVYLPRYAIYYFKDHIQKFVAELAFVVEGRGEQNLPEQLIASLRVTYPDISKARTDLPQATVPIGPPTPRPKTAPTRSIVIPDESFVEVALSAQTVTTDTSTNDIDLLSDSHSSNLNHDGGNAVANQIETFSVNSDSSASHSNNNNNNANHSTNHSSLEGRKSSLNTVHHNTAHTASNTSNIATNHTTTTEVEAVDTDSSDDDDENAARVVGLVSAFLIAAEYELD